MKVSNQQLKTNLHSMNQPLLPALRRLLPLFLLLLGLPLAQGQTQPPPGTMSFQGYLTDQNGSPLGATNVGPKNYTVVFRIWDSATGGNELHAEQQTVTVNNGYFSILLGQGSPYNSEPNLGANLANAFTGSRAASRYVEMTVNLGNGSTPTPLAPRLQLVSSPYAYLAANAVNAVNASTLVNTNGNAAAVAVSPGGYVGINTTTPGQQLEVNGNELLDGTLSFSQSLGDRLLLFPDPQGGYGFGIQGNLLQIHTDTTGADIAFGSGASSSFTEKMRIKGNGNVGINTITPGQPLEVNGNAQVDQDIYNQGTLHVDANGQCSMNPINNANAAITYGISFGATGTGEGIFSGRPNGSYNQGGLTFETRFLPRMAILNNGNVGIGTNTPSQLLEVNGNAQMDGNAQVGGTLSANQLNTAGHVVAAGGPMFIEASGDIYFRHDTTAGNTNTGVDTFHISSNGNVGIGTTSPNFPLDIESVGSGSKSYAGAYQFNQNGYNPYNNITIQGSTVGLYVANRIVCGEVDAVSDARVKEIVDRSESARALADVRKLTVTDYRKIDRVQFGGRLERGVIAQEVEKVLPGAVSQNTNFVPNVYALAKTVACTNQTLVITVPKPHELTVGNTVRLLSDAGQTDVQVTSVDSPTTFAVAAPAKVPAWVFVFGKQVGDFRSVNYDYLFTTGLGAIQELAKRADAADARVESLSKRVDELAAGQKNVAELERKAAQVDELSRQVAELKKLVAQLARPNAGNTTARTAVDAPAIVATITR